MRKGYFVLSGVAVACVLVAGAGIIPAVDGDRGELTDIALALISGGATCQCTETRDCWIPKCKPIVDGSIDCGDETNYFDCAPDNDPDHMCVGALITCDSNNRPFYDSANCSGTPVDNSGHCQEGPQLGAAGSACS